MAKNVFNENEIKFMDTAVIIKSEEKTDLKEEVVEYNGPNLEEIKNEIDKERSNWEREKAEFIKEKEVEARNIIEEARKEAQEIKEKTLNEVNDRVKISEEDINANIIKAKTESKRILENANTELEALKNEAFNKGIADGEKKGWIAGKEELNRLIERFHIVMNNINNKRISMLEEIEPQVLDLIIQISRKVIKVISENQRDVILENVSHALKKIKRKGEVIIRVNLIDLEILTEHKEEFIENLEKIEGISLLEDSNIEPGGCIIETDFGRIDARIFSQLQEIERKILDAIPIKKLGLE